MKLQKNQINNLVEGIESIDYTKYNSLFDVFVPTVIRNNERNNYELTGETRWTITAVDTGLKTITFDNELPFEINPEISRRKWGLFISVSNTCIIDAVDYSTKTITYSADNSTPTVGDKVFFYNPYASFAAENNNNPIPVNNNLATDLYNFLGAVWRHSDGTWRGWVKGWLPGNSGCSFIASSPDMVNWTGINGTLQEKGQGKFTHSYITAANGISIVGGAVPIPNSDGTKYASTFYTAGNGKRDTGIVIYDEDGIILNVSTGFLLDNFLCSIVHHHNNYYLYSCEVPDSDVSNRVIKETIVKDLNTLDVISSQTLEFTRGVNNEIGNPLSSHAGQPGAFIYNDEVYVIFGGTGELGINDNPFSGNRMFQLMRRKEDGTFEFPKDNPYIINPLHSELFWDQTTWNNDHPGAYPLIVIDRNKLYFHFTITNGTDSYQMALYSKILN